MTQRPISSDNLPLLTPDEHRIAVAELMRRCQGNADALRLASEIERGLRFELETHTPEPEQLFYRLAASGSRPAKRIAIITDIHGHYAGIMAAAALDDIAIRVRFKLMW